MLMVMLLLCPVASLSVPIVVVCSYYRAYIHLCFPGELIISY